MSELANSEDQNKTGLQNEEMLHFLKEEEGEGEEQNEFKQ